MSPTPFKPSGFKGGYDHRFIRPFQPDAGGTPPVDPNANVRDAYIMNGVVRGHAHSEAGKTEAHAKVTGSRFTGNSYGYDLRVGGNG